MDKNQNQNKPSDKKLIKEQIMWMPPAQATVLKTRQSMRVEVPLLFLLKENKIFKKIFIIFF